MRRHLVCGCVRCGATQLRNLIGGDVDNSTPYPIPTLRCSQDRTGCCAAPVHSTSIACGMFGVLTSALARECRSVVTGRMAGALFAGEGDRSALEGPNKPFYSCEPPLWSPHSPLPYNTSRWSLCRVFLSLLCLVFRATLHTRLDLQKHYQYNVNIADSGLDFQKRFSTNMLHSDYVYSTQSVVRTICSNLQQSCSLKSLPLSRCPLSRPLHWCRYTVCVAICVSLYLSV